MTGSSDRLHGERSPLIHVLRAAADLHSDRIAIDDGREALSYGAFADAIRSRSGRLSSVGVADGRNPATLLILNQSASALVTLFATMDAGLVPFIADPTWDDQDIRAICRTYHIPRVMTVGSTVSTGEGAVAGRYQVDGDVVIDTLGTDDANTSLLGGTTAFVRFSSGSTGLPRALEFEAPAAIQAAETWREASALGSGDRIFCLATLNNGLAFNTSLLACFLSGSSLYLYDDLMTPKAILRRALDVQPTVLVGFPFVWQHLLRQPDLLRQALEKTRLVVSSAAPLRDGLADDWQQTTRLPIGHYYGIAETGPVTFNDGTHPHTAGRLLPGVHAKIDKEPRAVDPGEILVRTQSHASSYVPDGGPTLDLAHDADGFYRTGDLGNFDADGNLCITGRLKRIANIAGRKFSLIEVEKVLAAIDGVCGVHVTLDPDNAEHVVAIVESRTQTPASMRSACLSQLPAWQIPHHFIIQDSLPRSAAGKVRFTDLSELLKDLKPEKTE